MYVDEYFVGRILIAIESNTDDCISLSFFFQPKTTCRTKELFLKHGNVFTHFIASYMMTSIYNCFENSFLIEQTFCFRPKWLMSCLYICALDSRLLGMLA